MGHCCPDRGGSGGRREENATRFFSQGLPQIIAWIHPADVQGLGLLSETHSRVPVLSTSLQKAPLTGPSPGIFYF